MVGLIIFIVAGFLILHGLICWIVITDDIMNYDDYYDKCYGCISGFCMESPNSDECLKIRKKLNKKNKLNKDPGE